MRNPLLLSAFVERTHFSQILLQVRPGHSEKSLWGLLVQDIVCLMPSCHPTNNVVNELLLLVVSVFFVLTSIATTGQVRSVKENCVGLSQSNFSYRSDCN